MQSSDEQLEVYVDRSLGTTVVPAAIRARGIVVHTEIEVFGRVANGVSDTEWLERAGSEDWIVFTKDTRLRYRTDEIAALTVHRVRVFVLTAGNLGATEQAARFVNNLNRIRRVSRRPGPCVYAVHMRGLERLWPRDSS